MTTPRFDSFSEGAVSISLGWQTTEEDMLATASAFNEIALVA